MVASIRTPLRVLVLSSLYPSAARPSYGIFVETRLRHLLAIGNIHAQVVAPVPWFPVRSPLFGRYAAWAATPHRENRFGIGVVHPRYAMLPAIGVPTQPLAMALAAWGAIRLLRREGFEFDVIDAHYLYPDGVAASLISRWIGKPFVLTARGSDLNVLVNRRYIRDRVVAAAHRAARLLCVSGALRDCALAIGIPASHVEVSRNGVDTTLFNILDRQSCRRRLAVPDGNGPLLLCVGNLVPEKGHELAIRALAEVPAATLVIVGNGPLRRALEGLGARLGVQDRLLFRDAMPQAELANVYNAADLLLHPSLREGWPNVLLEAMACGTAVIATDAGAASEIVSDPVAGTIVPDRSERALANAIRATLEDAPRRSAIRRHAARFGWEIVVRRHREVLAAALDSARMHGGEAVRA